MTGLTTEEAAQRLGRDGPNELAPPPASPRAPRGDGQEPLPERGGANGRVASDREEKHAGPDDGDGHAFRGTSVVSGTAVAVVTATARRSWRWSFLFMVALAVGSRPRTSHAASHLRHPHGRAALDAAADVFFAFLVVMTPCYLAVVEIAKRRFYRDAGI